MSTVQLLRPLFSAVLGSFLCLSTAFSQELSGYKDDLFGYPAILETADGGAFLKVDYDKMRDIHKRDEVPERRVKGRYVSLGVRWKQDFETVASNGRSVEVFRAGTLSSARFAVIFVHGRGGDRKLGANDFNFGGNFNRLKNLAVANRGVYYAPSITDFEAGGAADITALVDHIALTSPKAKIVVACASMGSFICWKVAHDAVTSSRLSGMIIMGGSTDPSFLDSAAHSARLPMFFSHGSDDTVYAAGDQVAFFRKLIAEGYPARFVLFETGSHGTPIRMTDWRDSLNWILR